MNCELCDRVAVIHQGRLLACDTPEVLKQRVQRYPTFELSVTPGASGWHHLDNLPGVQCCRIDAGPSSIELKVSLHEEAVVGAVVQEILRGGGRILSLRKVERTLEDVFVELVGHLPERDTPRTMALFLAREFLTLHVSK